MSKAGGCSGRAVTDAEMRDWIREVGESKTRFGSSESKDRNRPKAAISPSRDIVSVTREFEKYMSAGMPDRPSPSPNTLAKTVQPGVETAEKSRHGLNGIRPDEKFLRRLRAGKITPERRIDLHGQTQARASDQLDRFFDAATSENCRVVLVITGRGNHSSRPVLRDMFENWARHGRFAEQIFYTCYAPIKYGGSGATYVVLRRNRNSRLSSVR